MAGKSCVFCGSSHEITGEHIFGAWLGRLGLPQEPSPHRAGPLNRSPREMGVTPPFKSTVRAVCASCNNGWMSSLEAAAARALPPLILDGRGAIEPNDVPLIAAWVQKTALVSMLVSSQEQRAAGYGLPAAEYHALFAARESAGPLPDTMAWIGRYDGERVRASACVTPMVVSVDGVGPLETPQAYLATVVLGKLLLQILRFTTSRLAVDVSASGEFSRLWPVVAGAVCLRSSGIDDKRINRAEKGAMLRSLMPGVLLEPWKPATDLSPSTLQDSMVRLPTPCGEHFIFYPANLAVAGIHGKYHAFLTSCECGKGYLVVTDGDGAHFNLVGARQAGSDAYERVRGEEITLSDENGVFCCKRLSGEWEG